MFFVIISTYLPKVMAMEHSTVHGTSLLSTPGQFGPILLPEVSKNDDKKLCFFKKFGFITSSLGAKKQDLWQKINILKENHCILSNTDSSSKMDKI